ncbi:hypothetical protein [Jeongeupia naejangsanensis]|uniref:Restriction endonuclease type IV Mrr domain-containing protein n=1 Tax=Jeongeupia naejangsanensis TaxID=613195 RepID=A0ABS2BIP8_9NEIS|nr:hypothetical protein [Jeongeupia naejangsanensis]MBM3114968.1 hypothetical protein [Jeongeupia naejangsanensis]
MLLEEDKLAGLLRKADGNPRIKLQLRRMLVEEYSDFVDVLYDDLDEIVDVLQRRKQIYCAASEDEITMALVDQLVARGYQATHDTKNGGHIDIYVQGVNPTHLWLGEAKRDYDLAWYAKGFAQLCSRYSTGGHNQRHGGVLIYCQRRFSVKTLKSWREYLPTLDQYAELKVADCSRTPDVAFESEHLHDTSGLPYTVRHLVVSLYHAPTV